ncbi:MAG: hypothetical protein JNN12_16215 [Bacteroidetes Order II. Incertae sedis bacterium]|nr:hypothetical protein [Bacteroidetes Order II. bacterium]
MYLDKYFPNTNYIDLIDERIHDFVPRERDEHINPDMICPTIIKIFIRIKEHLEIDIPYFHLKLEATEQFTSPGLQQYMYPGGENTLRAYFLATWQQVPMDKFVLALEDMGQKSALFSARFVVKNNGEVSGIHLSPTQPYFIYQAFEKVLRGMAKWKRPSLSQGRGAGRQLPPISVQYGVVLEVVHD